jgi:hypothetical protein
LFRWVKLEKITMYREQYCQRRAIDMYASGKTKADVIQMLRAENAKETNLGALAEKFYQDYAFLRKEKRKHRRQNAERDIMIGSVISAAGVVLSLLSYLSIGSGEFVLFLGIIITGVVFLGKGVIGKMNLKKEASPRLPV